MLASLRVLSLRLVHLVTLTALVVCAPIAAQQMPDELMEPLRWRELGPTRGGRSAAVKVGS